MERMYFYVVILAESFLCEATGLAVIDNVLPLFCFVHDLPSIIQGHYDPKEAGLLDGVV